MLLVLIRLLTHIRICGYDKGLLIRIRCHGGHLLVQTKWDSSHMRRGFLMHHALASSYRRVVGLPFFLLGKTDIRFLCPIRRANRIQNLSTIQTILESLTSDYQIRESNGRTPYQLLIIGPLECSHEHINQFLLQEWGLNSASSLQCWAIFLERGETD